MAAARGGAGARPGAGGMMPPMGPGGMPDLSKLNPSQMRAMQVRLISSLPVPSSSRRIHFSGGLLTQTHPGLFLPPPLFLRPPVDAPRRRARDDAASRGDGGDAEDDVWYGRHGGSSQPRRDGRHAQGDDGRSMKAMPSETRLRNQFMLCYMQCPLFFRNLEPFSKRLCGLRSHPS